MIVDRLKGKFDIAEIAGAFDAMNEEQVVRETRALGQSAQRALWEASNGWKPMTFMDLVPTGVPDDHEVIHQGRNTLPAFSIFQKRFARPKDATGELWGYNEQSFRWFTGPGSFIVSEHDGELHIETMRTPPRAIPGWPQPESNAKGINYLVYGNLIDKVRKVSTRVSIGQPNKKGKPMGSFFVLARLDR